MGTSPGSDPRAVRATTDEMLAQSMWLRRLARSLVADSSSADDLVQDAWIAALKSPPEGDRPLRPWLARVVTNLVRTHHRVDTTRRERESGHVPRDHAPSASESIEAIDMQRVLLDAVEALPEPQRSTIVRHYFKGLTSIEIAREDGVADSTVRWRIAQAIETLRKRLDARHDGDRGTWMSALLPLARRAEVTGGPVAAAAAGGILMTVWMKVILVAAIVALCSVGAVWSLRTSAPTAIALGSTHTIETSAELDALAKPTTPGQDASRTQVATSVDEIASTSPSAAASNVVTVEARVLDAQRHALVGARMSCKPKATRTDASPEPAQETTSDATGLVRLSLHAYDAADLGDATVTASPSRIHVVISAEHKTSQTSEIESRPGQTFSLGDVILFDAGSVVGRTVDENATPIEGVTMRMILPELTLEERDGVAKNGLFDKPEKRGAMTKADGTFSIADVATGFYRVWSFRVGWLHCVSEPFEVRTGETTRLGDVVLRDNPRAIHGRVIGLDQLPAADAEVQYLRRETDGTSNWISDQADHSGAFVVEWFDTPTIDICAQGSIVNAVKAIPVEQRNGPAEMLERGQALVHDVPAGARDLVVRLMPSPTITITVKDQEGRPIDKASIGVFDPSGSGSTSPCPGGVRNTRLNGKPTVVVAGAPGFVTQKVGPFETAAAPPTLDFTLVPMAKISGRVTEDGKPSQKGRVTAMRVYPPGDTHTSHGFALRLDPMSQVSGWFTHGDGTFAFSVETEGRWVIVVHGFGRATWMSDVLELGPTKGNEGLEIALDDGGSLEGHVAALSNGALEAAFVTASHGTGVDDVSSRIAADGTFRVDKLTPGKWLVRITPRDFSRETEYTDHAAPDPACREVTIVAGKTTHVELDARNSLASVLEGRVGWPGVDMRGWTASVLLDGGNEDRWTAEPVDANGTFHIDVDSIGSYRLRLSSPSTTERSETIENVVVLAHGTTRWALDAAMGSVRLPAADATDATLTWAASSEAKWTAHVRKGGVGEVMIEHVPAGTVHVEAKDGRSAEVDVVANGVSAVTLH